MIPFLFTSILCLVPASDSRGIHHIPRDYSTIQSALESVPDGDTILVAPGTYYENIDFMGKAVTLVSLKGPDETCIDGGGVAAVVTFMNHEGPDSILEGFTLTNGCGAPGNPFLQGGGLCCDGASPLIRGNRIMGNRSFGIGCRHGLGAFIVDNVLAGNELGGIYTFSNRAAIKGNTLSGNGGPGITCACEGLCALEGNEVFANEGPGILCLESGGRIVGNRILSNAGTGLSIQGSGPAVLGNMIVDNNEGGIACLDCGMLTPILANNTVCGNRADAGGGLFIEESFVVVSNAVFWNNEAAWGKEICVGACASWYALKIDHSDIEGGYESMAVHPQSYAEWGIGMIDADPLFVDKEGGDFHLLYPSPCRDAGDSLSVQGAEEDFEGDPRVAFGKADMGADEFHPHLYCLDDPVPGEPLEIRLIARPRSWPVRLVAGAGWLDTGLPTPWGPWYLMPPYAVLAIAWVPWDGLVRHTVIAPLGEDRRPIVPLQALVGRTLTNLCLLRIR